MKKRIPGIRAIVLIAAFSVLLTTQTEAQKPGGERGRPPHGGPLLRALDLDEDGALSVEEIENASASLLSLDGDGDGALAREELRPPRPHKGKER